LANLAKSFFLAMVVVASVFASVWRWKRTEIVCSVLNISETSNPPSESLLEFGAFALRHSSHIHQYNSLIQN